MNDGDRRWRPQDPIVGRPKVGTHRSALLALALAAGVAVAGCGDGLPQTQATGSDVEQAVSTSTPTQASTPASITAITRPSAASAVIDPATISAMASTELPDDGPLTYGVGNLFDGDPTTAWNHDHERAPAIGQVITFEFDEPIELSEIRIVNGYVKSDKVFLDNARVHELTVTTESPEASFPIELKDQSEVQIFSREYGPVTSVRLEIASVYDGLLYDDVALSAIEFVGSSVADSE